jgi:hypothetical protein
VATLIKVKLVDRLNGLDWRAEVHYTAAVWNFWTHKFVRYTTNQVLFTLHPNGATACYIVAALNVLFNFIGDGVAQSVWRLWYGLVDRSSISGRGRNFIFFASASRPALGPTHPPIQWVAGALYPEVKQPGRTVDHSSPSNAEFKNAWSYTCFFFQLASTVLTDLGLP